MKKALLLSLLLLTGCVKNGDLDDYNKKHLHQHHLDANIINIHNVPLL